MKEVIICIRLFRVNATSYHKDSKQKSHNASSTISFYASFERPLNSHDKVQKHPLKNALCILCLQFQ